eukprot:g7034.t1
MARGLVAIGKTTAIDVTHSDLVDGVTGQVLPPGSRPVCQTMGSGRKASAGGGEGCRPPGIDFQSRTVVEKKASTAAGVGWWGRCCGREEQDHEEGAAAEKRAQEVAKDLSLGWLLARPEFPRGIAGTEDEEWRRFSEELRPIFAAVRRRYVDDKKRRARNEYRPEQHAANKNAGQYFCGSDARLWRVDVPDEERHAEPNSGERRTRCRICKEKSAP